MIAKNKTNKSLSPERKKLLINRAARKVNKQEITETVTEEQSDQPIDPQVKKQILPNKRKQKTDSNYMNAQQVEHFRNILSTWRNKLLQEIGKTVEHMQADVSNFPDPNDRATQEEELALELRTREREHKLIAKIEQSIAKLDTNEYGYCEICGMEIGIGRLEARATASQCIDCKTLDEMQERHQIS